VVYTSSPTNGTSAQLNFPFYLIASNLESRSRSTPSSSSALNELTSVLPHRRLTRQLKTFDDISSALTLSSPSRLDLPEIYDAAKESLSSFFPHKPTRYEFGQTEEALLLAIERDVKPVRGKPITTEIILSFAVV